MKNTEFPPYDARYTNYRRSSFPEAEYKEYVFSLNSGKTTEQAVVKVKLSKPPPTRNQNYQQLQDKWKQEQMS